MPKGFLKIRRMKQTNAHLLSGKYENVDRFASRDRMTQCYSQTEVIALKSSASSRCIYNEMSGIWF